ncbi:MAG TPA: SH3 domain-containing protein [Allosphingosinicella sp.]
MSLLCQLGRHRPRGIPRWNDGLYFATCERCGRDLVRTAFEGWHVPSGYRVVWSDRPPADRPEVGLVPEGSGAPSSSNVPAAAEEVAHASEPGATVAFPASEAASDPTDPSSAPSPAIEPPEPEPEAAVEPIVPDDAPPARAPVPAVGSNKGRLPIQDVLAHLNAEESANRARQTPPAQGEIPARQPEPAPAEPSGRQRRSTWDFMDDDPLEEDSASGRERARVPTAAAGAGAAPSADREAQPVSRKAGGLPEQWRRVRSAVHNFWSGPAEPRPMLVTGLAAAVAVAVALGLYSAGYPAPGSSPGARGAAAVPRGGPEGSETGEKPDPFAASAPHVSPGQAETADRQEAVNGSASDEVAYVAASLLVCRSAPVPQAPRVRNLLRGKEVRVLGYDGAWASLAYRGGQCWAQAQYLSPVPTM